MIKAELGLKVELPQSEFLKALSENNSSGRFSHALGKQIYVDIGEIRNDIPHRIIVGNQSTMAEIFPRFILANASNVVSVTMSQDEFVREVSPKKIEGVIDIGHVDKENRASRTIIAMEGQMQVIFPNIEFPLI